MWKKALLAHLARKILNKRWKKALLARLTRKILKKREKPTLRRNVLNL
jgi:hypothetical protein